MFPPAGDPELFLVGLVIGVVALVGFVLVRARQRERRGETPIGEETWDSEDQGAGREPFEE